MEYDYRRQILDEISVEGLDGITLQALWLRLQNNPHYSLGFSSAAKKFVWQVIITLEDVDFFKLSQERNALEIHDRYKYMDGDLGIVVEPDTLPEDIYPFSLVDDTSTGIKGSCSSYKTRKKFSSECRAMSLEEAESLGRYLVMVASQGARTEALTGEDYDPLSVVNITAIQWAILERIGRARSQGEVTQGRLSLQFMNENPKTLFYHRKALLAKSLIVKQVHHQKAKGQNFQGTLFHLPRFFVERKPKALVLVRKTIEFLKTTPKGMATYEDVKSHLNLGNAAKKLFKTHEFQRYMKGDVRVLHRDLHPDALQEDWQRKGNNQEKTHRVVKLINPEVEPDDVFDVGEEEPVGRKNDAQEEMEAGTESASLQEQQSTSGAGPGLLDQSLWVLDRTMMWQAYRLLEKAGPEGLSQQQLGAKLGHGKLEARTICRNLLRRELVATVMKDIGRQRVTNFVAKKWEHLSSSTTQLREEKLKMEELVGSRERIKQELHNDVEDSENISNPKGKKKSRSSITPKKLHTLQETKLEPPSTPATPKQRSSLDHTSTDLIGSELGEALEKTVEESVNSPPDGLDPGLNSPPDGLDPGFNSPPDGLDPGLNSPPDGLDPGLNSPPDGLDPGINDITVTFSSGLDVADRQWRSRERRLSIGGDAKEKNGGVTFRQLRRANTIIEAVRLHRVIDDPTKLYKIIQENEAKEGYEARMDKKSLMRLISRLEAEGQVKEIRVDLDLAHKKKVLIFICDPDIDESNTVIQSAVEQAKMKFSILPRLQAVKPVKKEVRGQSEEFTSESVTESLAEMMELNSLPGEEKRKVRPVISGAPPGKVTYNQRFGRKYGLQPKFVRMRELHLLLHYLIYGYTGNSDLEQSSATAKMQHLGLVDAVLLNELQDRRIYCPDISWRMFIPPLPVHQGWGEGWCLMCDVLLRLPLSIFVKLVNITFEVSGLQDYLTHPVRRHYLIRSLPHSIRNKLLYQRKYIFTVHEVATRLAYIGVLQFGPQKLKEKDQVFLYLNQRSSLHDTTTSSPGYHQVSTDKEFPIMEHSLHSMVDVEKYWYDMWLICVYTPLGGSAAVTGQEIVLELMDRKPAMIQALNPRSAETAPLNDDGHVPGDGLGAAGLDSSIFAHLKRNWTWNTSAGCRKGDKLVVPPFSMTELPEGSQFGSGIIGTGAGVVVTTKPNVKRTTKGQKRRASSPEPSSPPAKKIIEDPAEVVSSGMTTTLKPRRPAKFTRVVGRRKKSQERKPYYDEKDKAALRLMRKLRVDWSAGEDSFLLLCKVAGSFLCSNSRNQMVQYTAVRDLLHEHFPESGNKTSRACQRRLNYMMKNPTTADNVALFLADVKQAEEVVRIFSVPEAGSVNRIDNEARLERDFKPLVALLLQKYRDDSSTAPRILLPDTMEAINKKYSLIFPQDTNAKHEFREPSETSDIRAGVVNALITSSLCSASDKKSWAFQLFKIYQQYPDSLLRGVMAQLRTSKMVSLKKHYNKTKVKHGNYLPLSSSPYQLSVTFSHTLLCRYQYDIYTQAWHLAARLLNNQDYTDIIINQEGGFAATVVGLMARDRLQFRTEVPEQLVVLDPTLSSVDENYVRILTRYKELLRNAGGMDSADLERMCRSPTKLTSTALFTRHNSESPDRGLDVVVRSVQSADAEGSTVVGEEKVEVQEKGDRSSHVVFQDGEDNSRDSRSNSTVAKSASRIALYMMREEMKDSPLEASSPVQHSHDFFVISSCQVFARLRKSSIEKEEAVVKLGSVTAPVSEMPGNVAAAEKILNKHGVDITGKSSRYTESLRRTCVPLAANELDNVEEECVEEGWREEELGDLRRVVKEVEEKGEMGAFSKDLKRIEMEGGKGVEEVLEKALEKNLVIVAGVVKVRYVAYRHAKNWLLHSIKLNRVRDVERMESLKFSGKLYQGNEGPGGAASADKEGQSIVEKGAEKEETSKDKAGEEESNKDWEEASNKDGEEASNIKAGEDASNDGETTVAGRIRRSKRRSNRDASPKRRPSRDGLAEAVGGEDIRCNSLWKNPQVGIKLSREVAEAVDKIDWEGVEEVLVNVRPWIRVDGSLNRRVLDRLLGAVLGTIMQWPGQTLLTTLSRFSPALQPHHSRELVWMLVELEAVYVHRYILPQKPSLFSKPSLPVVQPAGRLDEDCEVVVEAAVDAITRLGMFIGDKQYVKDFVCQCPCHPDRRM